LACCCLYLTFLSYFIFFHLFIPSKIHMVATINTTQTFPPLKKLHSNIGFQMIALESAIGDPPSVRRKVRRRSTMSHSKEKNMALAMNLEKSQSSRSSFSSKVTSNVKEDRDALALALQEIQIMLMQSKSSWQRKKSATVAGSCTTSRTSLSTAEYTLYLPNFMWFQPIAIHSTTNMIRPTSLCSGTGITGGNQYLQPEMMKMFSVFGSYLNGSGHLFNADDDTTNNSRRRAFWVDTIDENDDELESEVDDDDHGGHNSSGDSACTDDDDDDDEGSMGSDVNDSLCMTQDELIEKVIIDLRRSQMMA